MTRTVVVRREASLFDALSLPFQAIFIGSCIVIGIALFVPILIVLETKALFARHRIRKEQDLGAME